MSKKKKKQTSWKNLFKFYSKVKIPWWLVILTFILSFAVKEAESRLVPFTSAIQTGAITEYGFLGGFVVMTIVYGITEAVQGGVNELAAVATTRNVRRGLWRKLINLPMSVYRTESPQSFVSRVTQDTQGAYAAIACIIQMWAIVYGIYTNFSKMYRIYDKLALIMLTSIPLTIFISWIIGKMQYRMEEITNNGFAEMTNFFAERLPNLLHIKTCQMEDEEYQKGVKANEAKYIADIKRLNIFIFVGPLGVLAQYINQVILLIVATMLVRNGTMKMVQMINLYNYYILFMGNSMMITAIWQNIKLSHGACSKIAEMSMIPDENLTCGQTDISTDTDIAFKNVSFAYEEGHEVLKDVNFTIPKGKTTVIVGENGCGKSTLIKLLQRFEVPTGGQIVVGDTALEEISLAGWRDNVGHLFQSDHVVKGSLRENICYGLDRLVSDEEILEAAKEAKAYDFIIQKEEGLDAEVSKFDCKLSGGEAQRLAIARIILKNPQILIMDEATSGIDIINEDEIMDSINAVMTNKTVIMVSHDLDMIKKADNIVVINDGQVEASGSYEEVFRESNLFQRFAIA